MPSSHKNAGNEYLVHTDKKISDGWSFFGSSEIKELEAELEEQKQALLHQKLDNMNQKTRLQELQEVLRRRNETLGNVENELKCLKVDHCFLQEYVSEEQKQKMQREKQQWHETLKDFIEGHKDAEWMSIHKKRLKNLTDELNDYMKARHDDYDDKAIMSLTDFIRHRQLLS